MNILRLLGAALSVFVAALHIARSGGRRLERRNREIVALHNAALAISQELAIDKLLQRVVDEARQLVDARYGALALRGANGQIELFLTSGVSTEERERIGALPKGRGLLGVVLDEGQRLRLRDLGNDPRSVGFPPHHPPMRSLLAIPIFASGAPIGNLYLAEKRNAREFSRDDEETLSRFASQAEVAIANARLHRQVQVLAVTEERERIAREMHDSLAQVLGYVNTKAQAAKELIEAGEAERAASQIEQLSGAAQAAYVDVREGILALRTSLGAGRPLQEVLREYVSLWQEQSGVAAHFVDEAGGAIDHLSGSVEVQLLRIAQEALANVRKHARATQVAIRLAEVDGAIEATIQDDGVGFEPTLLDRSPFPRFGLATMKERAEALGGTLTVESAPGKGTRVSAWLPF